jgi:cold-inducible RNA-binding protein
MIDFHLFKWFIVASHILNEFRVKLFVGNLDERIEDVHLREAFSEFGTITTAKVIKDKTTGKSRGFGFIEMPNSEEALAVIKNVDQGTWEGKVITIKKAFK